MQEMQSGGVTNRQTDLERYSDKCVRCGHASIHHLHDGTIGNCIMCECLRFTDQRSPAIESAVSQMECNSYGLDGHIAQCCVKCRLRVASEQERLGQLEFFTDLLEVLEAGNTEAAKESVASAIKLLERENI